MDHKQLEAVTKFSKSLFGGVSVHSKQRTGSIQHYLQLKPPNWLTQKAWSIFTSKSYDGFKFHLRTYSVVPYDAPVIECARRGDIQGMLELFDQKAASPFDISESGDRLIEVSPPLAFRSS